MDTLYKELMNGLVMDWDVFYGLHYLFHRIPPTVHCLFYLPELVCFLLRMSLKMVVRAGNKGNVFSVCHQPAAQISSPTPSGTKPCFGVPFAGSGRCGGGVFGVKGASADLRTAAGRHWGAQQKKARRGERVCSCSVMKRGEFTAVKMAGNVAAVGMLEKSPELRWQTQLWWPQSPWPKSQEQPC